MNTNTRQKSVKIKALLGEALQGAIEKTLNDMGEDIHGIDWFSSYSEQYNEMRERKVA